MTTEFSDYNTVFNDLFGAGWNQELRAEDVEKGRALINVVTKSSASLADVARLAHALGLQVRIQAVSAPKPAPTQEEGK